MGVSTGIEWTDATWNPIRGCTRVSEGCRHCYAEGVARRFSGPGMAYEGLVRIGGDGKPHEWNGEIRFVEGHLLDPLRWKTSRRIFVNSMSDLFHENVTDEIRDRIFAVMALCPQHTFQVLTKRPERMLAYLASEGLWHRIKIASEIIARQRKMPIDWRAHRDGRWFDHLWLGVSVENQKAADERIPLLLQTPAAVRFLSCEPLLGPLSLRWLCGWGKNHPRHKMPLPDAEGRIHTDEYDGLRELDWVIAGGESGPNARPMHPDWARSLRDQCKAAGVPFFFKQWGEWCPADRDEVLGLPTGFVRPDPTQPFATNGIYSLGPQEYEALGYAWMAKLGKKAAGHLLDGVEHHAFPEVRA